MKMNKYLLKLILSASLLCAGISCSQDTIHEADSITIDSNSNNSNNNATNSDTDTNADVDSNSNANTNTDTDENSDVESNSDANADVDSNSNSEDVNNVVNQCVDACGEGFECNNGECVVIADDCRVSGCASGLFCDASDGQCNTECTANDQCPSNNYGSGQCIDGTCEMDCDQDDDVEIIACNGECTPCPQDAIVTECSMDGQCVEIYTCDDGILNGEETDIDCGGSDCEPCLVESTCELDADCITEYCNDGICENISDPFDDRACNDAREWTAAEALEMLGDNNSLILDSNTVMERSRNCSLDGCTPWGEPEISSLAYLTWSGGSTTASMTLQTDTTLVLYKSSGAPKLSIRHDSHLAKYPNNHDQGIIFGFPPEPISTPLLRAYTETSTGQYHYKDIENALGRNGRLFIAPTCAKFVSDYPPNVSAPRTEYSVVYYY